MVHIFRVNGLIQARVSFTANVIHPVLGAAKLSSPAVWQAWNLKM
jgi:hypothetical protein